MNRRSFITALLAGVAAPAFLPGAGRKWVADKVSGLAMPKAGLIVPNPEYATAPWELSFVWDDSDPFLLKCGVWPEFTPVVDPYPRRFKADRITPVPPFIYAR